MGKITATKINESYFYIEVDDGDLLYELEDRFAIYRDGYQFHPAYKNHSWDGRDRYFKVLTHYFPVGLVGELEKYCKQKNHKLTFLNYEPNPEWISREKLRANNRQILAGSTYTVRDYQEDAVYQALNNKMGILECCTSS